jgi:hypothetical protein
MSWIQVVETWNWFSKHMVVVRVIACHVRSDILPFFRIAWVISCKPFDMTQVTCGSLLVLLLIHVIACKLHASVAFVKWSHRIWCHVLWISCLKKQAISIHTRNDINIRHLVRVFLPAQQRLIRLYVFFRRYLSWVSGLTAWVVWKHLQISGMTKVMRTTK